MSQGDAIAMEGVNVNRMLDIFRMDAQGALWLEAAETLELAKSRAKELATISPGQYLVVDLATGNKHVISTGDLEVADKSRHAKYVNEEAR